MRRPATIAVFLALVLSCLPPLLQNSVFAHGDAPSTCENRYDADIASMAIDNGTQTFDPMSDSELEFDAQISDGYDVTFTLHTANVSSQNNTFAGTTWYRLTAFGFGSGVCVDDTGPDQDIQLTVHVEVMPGVPDGYTQDGVEWGSWPDTSQVRYNVVWHNATNPEPPVEEQPPVEQQPPQQNDTDQGSEDGLIPTDNNDPETNDDDEFEDEESAPDNDLTGTLISPFIFKNETTSASAAETDDVIEGQTPRIADALYINGTLASYLFLNGTQLYILSGNWSMAMNDTAVLDFGANFTMVRADGIGRQTYSLDNLTAVSDLDLLLSSGTMGLTSPLDYHANGTTTKVNATVTLAKLNVIKVELGNMSTPVYGMVDKVMRTENGETLVMERQFDMI
jgi:hypothetical protein